MKVLVACEYSGRVRDAFAKRGFDAWSADILPSETPGNHYQGDVLEILDDGWDLMIAHPPCTHLASSGARWFKDKQTSQLLAINFFRALTDANISRIAVENPIGIMSTHYRKPDQYIQPYEFGHPETKKTCLWLKNLPHLIPTNVVKPTLGSRIHKLPPSADRGKIRSLTYQGWADAMAIQWGDALWKSKTNSQKKSTD